MKWRAARIGDALYDLAHLHPFSFEFAVPAYGEKPELRYGIDVVFSLHCFTRDVRRGDVYAGEWAYSDSRETRLFDERRYRWSLQLPKIVRAIGERRCFHTTRDNFFTVEFVDEQGRAAKYTIYFKLSRSPRSSRLNLYIQSAYVQEDIPRSHKNPRKPIWFAVIAHNVSVGRPMSAPK